MARDQGERLARRAAGLTGDKQKRLAKIQQAMAALEAEVGKRRRKSGGSGRKGKAAPGRSRKKPGKPAAAPSEEPIPRRNATSTDPESRHHEVKDGFVQAYNAQAASHAGAQSLRRPELIHAANDQGQTGTPDRGHREQSRPQPEQGSATSGLLQRRQSSKRTRRHNWPV